LNDASVRLLASFRIAALLLLAWTVAPGCAGRTSATAHLPDAPIALLHWADKPAQRRAKAFESAAEARSRPGSNFASEDLEELAIRSHLNGERSIALAMQLAKSPGRLMLYWPRTEKLERVEAAPPGARPLAWSGDHRKLLFVSSHRGGRDQIFEYDLTRKDLRQLTFGPDAHGRADYLMRRPGDVRRRPGDPVEGGRDVPDSLSPDAPEDGASGAYVVQKTEWRTRGGTPPQSLVGLGGDGRIGTELARGIRPGTIRVVPGGRQVVYEQIELRPRSTGPPLIESHVAIRDLAPDGEEQRLLRGREPVLTPDGEWIVFASKSSAGYRLRRMRLDGTSRVPIGPGGTEERMPAVSPDGEFVAFIRETAGTRRLAIRSYDGKSTRVILRSGWSEFPVW